MNPFINHRGSTVVVRRHRTSMSVSPYHLNEAIRGRSDIYALYAAEALSGRVSRRTDDEVVFAMAPAVGAYGGPMSAKDAEMAAEATVQVVDRGEEVVVEVPAGADAGLTANRVVKMLILKGVDVWDVEKPEDLASDAGRVATGIAARLLAAGLLEKGAARRFNVDAIQVPTIDQAQVAYFTRMVAPHWRTLDPAESSARSAELRQLDVVLPGSDRDREEAVVRKNVPAFAAPSDELGAVETKPATRGDRERDTGPRLSGRTLVAGNRQRPGGGPRLSSMRLAPAAAAVPDTERSSDADSVPGVNGGSDVSSLVYPGGGLSEAEAFASFGGLDVAR